nr:Gag-Pol polyprotein [Tanacetum cinerariifolium]
MVTSRLKDQRLLSKPSRLQAIMSHLEFMDVEIKQDDLNQKFLTSLAPEWLMYTIVWRNIDDLDTISLDDVYNYLKVYETKVQKKSESNSQNMAFIYSSNTSSGKGNVHTASVPTASIQVSTASTDVAAVSLSHDTVYAYIATQLNGSQIKYEDITQIDEDDIEEMDIKWNMGLLSMRASSQKWNVLIAIKWAILLENAEHLEVKTEERENAINKEENHALVADDEVLTEFALMAKSSSSSHNEVYDDSYSSKSCRKNTKNLNTKISKLNEELSDCQTDLYNYKRGLSQVEARLVKYKEHEVKFCEKIRVLERDVEIRDNKIEYLKNELEQVKKEKESVDNKLTGFENASKDLDNLLGSQRSKKNKEGLPEFVDDTVTDYSRPTPSINASKCNKNELQSSNFSVYRESSGSIMSKPMIKFVKEADCPRVIKTNNTENARKSTMKYVEMYMNISKETYLIFLSMSPMMEDMSHLDMEVERLLALVDESMLCHRRLGHLNFKTMNKLVRNNLVKGLPSKCFENDHTCVACLKGKQHKASCKTKLVKSISKPLYTLHIDLFGPTSDETSSILRNFITEIENLKELKVKIIRVAERKNKTLIEAARTMLANAKLPVTFWAEAVNTAYHLGKFDAKGDEGYFVWYSLSSKAFTVFNKRTKKAEENLHIYFLWNKLIKKGAGPNWLFNIDTLTNSMNYVLVVVARTSSTNISGTKDVASQDVKKDVSSLRYIALLNWFHEAHIKTSNAIIRNSDAPNDCNATIPESSGISNPTATSKMDVKSAFLYGTIDEEVYVMQPSRFQDPEFLERVYKVEKATCGLHQAPRAWYEFEALMHDKFQMSAMGELTFFLGLQVLRKKDGIFLLQDKYIGDIPKKFGYSDVRSMIGSLMYLTVSRPDIMFAVCACARHQVTPKEYSDYGGATQDRKSTTGGCQFLGRRLISWQCKKQTIVASSTIEAEYVAAASGCG